MLSPDSRRNNAALPARKAASALCTTLCASRATYAQDSLAMRKKGQGLIETMPSISTEICIGSEPMPTAERACLPFSPNTSTNRSDMPLATLG
jgi:hypothetical protein